MDDSGHLRTSVQQLHGVGGGRGLAEGLGGDGQDPEGVAHTFGEAGDSVAGLLQTRSYDGPLDGAEGLLLDGKHQRGGIWSAGRDFRVRPSVKSILRSVTWIELVSQSRLIDRKTDESVVAEY